MKYQSTHILTLLAVIWMTLLPVVCSAQQPFQLKYTVDDGLPFAEVDDIRFTKNGEAWVRYTTGEVLSRFDGINWTHYRLGEIHLPLGLIFIAEDEYGVWFQGGSNDERDIACLTPEGVWKTYRLEGKHNFYISPKNGRFALVDAQVYSYQYDAKTDRFIRSEKPFYVPNAAKGELLQGMYNTIDGTPCLVTNIPSENKSLLRYGEGFQNEIPMPAPNFSPTYISGKTAIGVFWKDGQPHWWDGHQTTDLTITLPNGRKAKPTRWTLLNHWGKQKGHYNYDGLVVEDPLEGTLYLYHIDSTLTPKLLLSDLPKDYFRDTFSEDKHGNWWFGTSSGVMRTEQSHLVFHENTPGMVTGLHAISEDAAGNIWMGGYTGSGGFAVYDGEKLQYKKTGYPTMPVLPGTCRSVSGTLYFFTEVPAGIMAIKEDQLIPINIPVNEQGNAALGFYFYPLRNGQIALGLAGEGLGIATETGGLISSIQVVGKEKGLGLDNVLTVAEDEGGRLWCGRMSQGVAIYDPQRDTAVTWLRSPEAPNSVGMMASCVDENGTLWLGTNDGIRLLRNAHDFDFLKENLFDHLEKIPLPGRDAGWVNVVKNTGPYIVVGTNQGVYFFDKKHLGERPRIFSMMFGKDIAGGGTEQNAVLLDSKDGLWIGTQTGTSRMDLNNLQFDTSATTLQLEYLKAAGDEIELCGQQPWHLPMKKRNIKFRIVPSGSPFLKDDLIFDVVVVRHNGDTLFQQLNSREKTAEIAYLPHGEYTLHIAAYKHNVLSGQATWRFKVPKLPSESPWFWSLAAALLVGVPFFFFYQKKRHQIELEKSKRERDGLKIQALSNFFNPHFINNSLNYVQTKSLADRETVDVVDGLSQNVRILYRNTQNSRGAHSLVQELILVENYLRIQQKRFGASLTFDLPPHETWDEYREVVVPVLLLQIHVENAVEKGVRGTLMGNGHVSLRIVSRTDGWQFVIEDNGRGRPVEYLRTQGHRKGSTTVMDNLIALMNQYNSHRLTIHYEDSVFENERMEKHGTRVVIFIPKNYNYEFS